MSSSKLCLNCLVVAALVAPCAPSLRAHAQAPSTSTAAPAAARLITPDDATRWQDVGDPQLSPDGDWVAYTVSTVDTTADKRVTHLWMARWDGTEDLQLTSGAESTSAPRWSPDGKFLAFTSGRPGEAKGSQVWVLDRRGGEARQVTNVKGHLSGYAWSPDAQKLVFAMRNDDEPPAADPKPGDPPKSPKPIVIDRYHFKQDVEGYLTGNERSLLYIFDIASKKLDKLTTDTQFDEEDPAWSPDGKHIAFVSNHDADWDRSINTDVFVVDAQPKSAAKKLTTFEGGDGGRMSWSPDSRFIAYTQSDEPRYTAYSLPKLGIVGVDGSAPKLLTTRLDRPVASPHFAADGKTISVLVSDDRNEYVASVNADSGETTRLIKDTGVATGLSQAGNHTAVLWSTDNAPSEVFALEDGKLRRITSHNSAFLAQLKIGETRDLDFKSKDGTPVHGLITLPPDYQQGKKYPTLLRIHGGPNGQDAHSFTFERQLFAAHGFAVVNVNYRGSSGRGSVYQKSIFADWGDKEVADLLAAMDYVVAQGYADPDKLGIGGWSYGGILTDYTIATDPRFKVAISGAGSANQITMYGTDEYVFQYDHEIGPPWKNPEAWVKISYPFFKADHIHTPTLFMGGDKDFNVPVVGGEQMYEALRSLNVPTQLVIYPGQFHGFTRPSFIRDRYQRYLAWYDKYLPTGAAAATKPAAGN